MSVETQLLEILAELQEILLQLKNETPEKGTFDSEEIDWKKFFDEVRGNLFRGSLTQGQVDGMSSKVKAFIEAGFPLSWAAYALATSYHETAQRMLPVREGLSATEGWRRRNLRYYPYYGRGDVQLTWLANYQKVDKNLNLGGALLENLDLALDKDLSAKIMINGMKDGWFTGKKMIDYLPDALATREQFRQARRIINLMDKASVIADYAIKFQHALKEAGYGLGNSSSK